MKYHNHTLQTNRRHLKGEPHNKHHIVIKTDNIMKEDLYQMAPETYKSSEDLINISIRADNKKEALRQIHL